MRNLFWGAFLAVGFISATASAEIIHEQDFEGTDFDGYSTLDNTFTGNGVDYFDVGTNGSPFSFATTVTGFSGSQFVGLEDIDGVALTNPHWLELDPVDVSSFQNLSVSLLFAAPNPVDTRYETADYFIVEYSLDGSDYQTLGSFRGSGAVGMLEDDDLNGTFTVPVTGGAMTRFTYSLDARAGASVSGSSLKVRVRFNSEGSHEEMAFDDIIIEGTSFTSCGDGFCNGSETTANCASDCGSLCGDGVCNGAEATTDCPADCGSSCGDGVCNGAEATTDCPADCGSSCGDGFCNGSEATTDCPADCGSSCGDGFCNGSEATTDCPADCGSSCGDGVINGSEVCEPTDLDGVTCTSLGYAAGTLQCTSTCALDTTGCTAEGGDGDGTGGLGGASGDGDGDMAGASGDGDSSGDGDISGDGDTGGDGDSSGDGDGDSSPLDGTGGMGLGGESGNGDGDGDPSSGCSCRSVGGPSQQANASWLFLLLGVVWRQRRRRYS